MKERPILFSGPMVRAILEDRKTKTRRVVKPQPKAKTVSWGCIGGQGFGFIFGEKVLTCPYGQPGDRLWVRQSWWHYGFWDKGFLKPRWRAYSDGHPIYSSTDDTKPTTQFDLSGRCIWRRRPSIHMPRWASRITLEIKKIRVERVQKITPADAQAEGINVIYDRAKAGFKELWDSTNADRRFVWDTNPWLWVIEFKRVVGEGSRETRKP